jgi:hypothetical protein
VRCLFESTAPFCVISMHTGNGSCVQRGPECAVYMKAPLLFVSFTCTQAMEPAFSVALSALFLGEQPHPLILLTLLPIMGGVAMASMSEVGDVCACVFACVCICVFMCMCVSGWCGHGLHE